MALAILVAAGTIAAFGQSATVPPDAAPATQIAPELKHPDPRYQLHKSDTFDVNFAFSPEYNQTVTVEPDGYINLKEIGSVHAEGETVPELTESLKRAYAGILRDPVIAIALKDFEKPFFIASGQVSHPGRYELRGPLTVTQAVAIAGGFNDKAKHSQVVIFHPVGNKGYEARLLNVKKLMASRNLENDVYLQPGDQVYVPKSKLSKIRDFMPNTGVGAYYNPATF